MLSLNIGELNFAKKHRGKKPANTSAIIPTKLTRRHCASKVAEVYDLSGRISPLIASMKIDLQELFHQKLETMLFLTVCESNFQLMKEIGTLNMDTNTWILVMPVPGWPVLLSMQDFSGRMENIRDN